MSAIDQIAFSLNRRDEVPNQKLARTLAETGDEQGIREIAANLVNATPNIQSDCLKVLYEIGSLRPELIAPYLDDFFKLLKHKRKRMVWGAMIALACIASLKAAEIYAHLDEITHLLQTGSVITADNGVKILAAVSAKDPQYEQAAFPILLEHLQTCRPADVARHAEYILTAANPGNQAVLTAVLRQRLSVLPAPQAARVKKVIWTLYAG